MSRAAQTKHISERTPRIGLYGLYGWGSLGDLAIQQSMIHHIRKWNPSAEIIAICPNPEDASARLGVPALPISRKPGTAWPFQHIRIVFLFFRIFARLPMELILWRQVFQNLRGLDMLIISGGGQLDDYNGGAIRQPYDVFKWSVCARMRRMKLYFVSQGAGPIDSKVSWWLLKTSLSLADFRSYRDPNSRKYLEEKGFRNNDPICPDLAFSYPADPDMLDSKPNSGKKIIGVAPMSYYDPRGWPKKDEAIYTAYIQKLTEFVIALIHQGYTVSFIPGDSLADHRSIEDIKGLLRSHDPDLEKSIVHEPVDSVEEQLCEIAKIDAMVASRYHCLLFSLLLNKPALALSYHDKDDSLLDHFGLSDYCLPIETFEVHQLIETFNAMMLAADSIQSRLPTIASQNRALLDEQYRILF